ncbi:MAG: hypothetical protein ACRELA_08910 [Candidatus Rokuibacteriota bacterium]
MKKAMVWVALAAGLVMGTTGGLWAAAGPPASKATVRVAHINILSDEDLDYTTVLEATLRTANMKDLLLDVALECGLYTRTKVVSQDGILDTSRADSGVRVRVLLDPGTPNEIVAPPGETTYCRRVQQLSAVYNGVQNCQDENGDGTVQYDECELTPEETELLLDTMDASAFNFVIGDVTAGVHTIAVQAKIDLETSSDMGEAEAKAAIGNGAVTVEEVRLVRGAEIEMP